MGGKRRNDTEKNHAGRKWGQSGVKDDMQLGKEGTGGVVDKGRQAVSSMGMRRPPELARCGIKGGGDSVKAWDWYESRGLKVCKQAKTPKKGKGGEKRVPNPEETLKVSAETVHVERVEKRENLCVSVWGGGPRRAERSRTEASQGRKIQEKKLCQTVFKKQKGHVGEKKETKAYDGNLVGVGCRMKNKSQGMTHYHLSLENR